jgi:hypothetical protein
MWPHNCGPLSTARDEKIFRRNAVALPLYQSLHDVSRLAKECNSVLSMLETTQRCDRAGVAVRLIYTNPYEQRRTDVNAAIDKRAVLQAFLNNSEQLR